MGSTIRQKIPNSLAPSILAASTRAVGKFIMFCLIRKTPKAFAREGRMTAEYVFVMFTDTKSWNKGTYMTCAGIIMETMIKPKIRPLPLNSNFARMYPAEE